MIACFPLLKAVHVGAVAATFCLFLLRGAWMLTDSPHLRQRWVRVLPHAVDTVLLASALALMVTIHQYPFVHGWLTAKVFALCAYIVLGSLALKRAPTRTLRTAAFAGALAAFGYMVSVARLHDPRGFLIVLVGH